MHAGVAGLFSMTPPPALYCTVGAVRYFYMTDAMHTAGRMQRHRGYALHTAGLIPNTNPNLTVRKLQFTAVLYGYRA